MEHDNFESIHFNLQFPTNTLGYLYFAKLKLIKIFIILINSFDKFIKLDSFGWKRTISQSSRLEVFFNLAGIRLSDDFLAEFQPYYVSNGTSGSRLLDYCLLSQWSSEEMYIIFHFNCLYAPVGAPMNADLLPDWNW